MCALLINNAAPAGGDSPTAGDDQIRAFKLAVEDIFGIPNNTTISQAVMDVDAGGLAQVIFYDAAVLPASGELGRNGSPLYYRITDARTATTTRALGIVADTSGVPAASIGVGLLFQAESADESPADFGALDFVASDIGAGTEDTYASLALRVAGRALDEKYRFGSTAGDGFTAIFAHAVTADRTYTLPDADLTFPTLAAQADMETATSTTTFVSPGRTQYHPGVAKAWGQWNDAGTLAASYNLTSITDGGAGDHTANLTTAMSGTSYAVVGTPRSNTAIAALVGTLATGTFGAQGRNLDTPFAFADLDIWRFVVFGDQ